MAGTIGVLFQWLIFLVMALTSIVASILMITRKNPIHSALFLILNLLCVSVLYILLYSQFIAIIQVIVYAGAIVMLIIFVIMLLDLEDELRSRFRIYYSKVIGVILAFFFMIGIIYSVASHSLSGKIGPYNPERFTSNVKIFGELLLTKYLFPFEIVSILLLVAIIGAVILSKRRI